MCLVKPIIPRKTKGFGYKVLRQLSDGSLTNWDCSKTKGTIIYPIGKWLHDKNKNLILAHKGCYYAGFHLSLNENKCIEVAKHNNTSERQLVLVKVQYNKAHAKEGEPTSRESYYGTTVVTRNIKVLSVVKEFKDYRVSD